MIVRKQRVWFITGASQGLGRAVVEAALKNNDLVVAASRTPDSLKDLEMKWKNQLLPVVLDVKDKQQIDEAVNLSLKRFGRIDVLVNNAGYGLLGAVEEVSEDEEQQLFEVNVFGLLAVTRAILPTMRNQRSGHILNLSSVGGMVAGTGSGLYAASKFAVEGLSEAMAAETAPLGIKVTIVEPGQFRTGFLGESISVAKRRLEDYRLTAGAMQEALLNRNGLQPGDPAKAADAIVMVVESERPPLRLPLGKDCIDRIRTKLDSVAAEILQWETVAINTGFDVGSSVN